eukprot:Gb_34350 [translate_table: standard]
MPSMRCIANRLPLVCVVAEALKGSEHRQATPIVVRLDEQQKKLNLPILPTTTIGSFPQTVELRRVRREYKGNKIAEVKLSHGNKYYLYNTPKLAPARTNATEHRSEGRRTPNKQGTFNSQRHEYALQIPS